MLIFQLLATNHQLWISNKSWISKNSQKTNERQIDKSGPREITFGQNLNWKCIKSINC